MDNLKDVKEDAKLENCVVIQVDAEEEDVMEHFCGISSDFVDNFESMGSTSNNSNWLSNRGTVLIQDSVRN